MDERREPEFDERRFMSREQAEADDTVDLHEHDDPTPRYEALRRRQLSDQPDRP